MPTVICPACATRLQVGDDAAGRPLRCPKCAYRWVAEGGGNDAEAGEPEVPGGSAVRTVGIPLVLVLFAATALLGVIVAIRIAQDPEPAREAFGKAGEALSRGTGAMLGLALVAAALAYVPFVLGVFCWVARDADSRGHVGVLWALVYGVPQALAVWMAFLTSVLIALGIPLLFLALGWVGLVLYLFGRRPGVLVRCRRCPNRRLDYAAICPHCGKP